MKNNRSVQDIRGILPGVMTTESLVDLQCGLVFVSGGIIVAFLEVPSVAQVALGALSRYSRDYHIMKMAWSKLEHRSAEEMLGANKRNFLLPYSEITKVEIGKKFLKPCVLRVHSQRGVLEFKFYAVRFYEIEEAVRSFFPTTITVMRWDKSN